MNMTLGQKKIYGKCLTKYDILQHVSESSERVIFITNVRSVLQRIPQEKKKKDDHYSPSEIRPMMYETRLSCKAQPLSRAVYLKRHTEFSESREEPARSKAYRSWSCASRRSAKRGPAAPQPPDVMPEPLQWASADPLLTVWPSAAKGQEPFLLGWVLSPHPLPAWSRRPFQPSGIPPSQ